MQNYIEKVKNLQTPTFQQIRNVAHQEIAHLSEQESQELYESLNRGVNLLGTHSEMCKYLWSFGNMHEAKIHDAVKHLPNSLFENPFEIVDWGCGQGLATICFFDYLVQTGCNINAEKATLIEPSKIALDRAQFHVNTYLKNPSKITPVQKFLDDVTKEDIKPNNEHPIIHFFSNILDIIQIDLKKLATKINEVTLADNYIVCVGPLNSGNHRIDAFYNYFDVPILYEQENSQFPIGNNKTKTYKAKVYKLEYSKEGNLIPIEYYPSVQFHAAYQLDAVRENLNNYTTVEKQKINKLFTSLTHFETATPFDIGASVYEDIHPILAVLNNLVTRGIPTKASPYIEQIFLKAFEYSKQVEVRGEMIFKPQKTCDLNHLLTISTEDDIQLNSIESQLLLSPIAIARIQKTILEALMTDKLSIEKGSWKIMVEERDVPCAALAFKDLEQMFNSLTKLSIEYQNEKFPKIELDIISPLKYVNSPLHLDCEASSDITKVHKEKTYDLVIDHAVLQKSEIDANSFSQFQVLNNCYFNIRSSIDNHSERTIYTTDLIQYRDLVSKDSQGTFTDIEETKNLLTYFLQLLFRKTAFRPGQLPILNRALQNKGVIGLLPTGGGKSLTYQIAALLQPGVTLIVDPLKALMKDQYDGLIKAGIDSCSFINGELSKKERELVENSMEESKLQFVFLSPERLAIYKFREKLKNMHQLNVYFSYGVIDEVHCVSEWGHDFRTNYLHLGRNLYQYVKAKEGNISLLGLTATASFDVLADVERELSGQGAFELDADTIIRYENSNRLELQYKIEKVDIDFEVDNSFDRKHELDESLPRAVKMAKKDKFYNAKKEFLNNYVEKIPEYLNQLQTKNSIEGIKSAFIERQDLEQIIETNLQTNMPKDYYLKNKLYEQSGIVFCPHVKNTEISVKKNKESLQKKIPDIGIFYGNDNKSGENDSMRNLELFRENKQPLMVATKAFGMGIDKSNVRFTVNMNYSSSLEGFVQQAGRAGRDRKMALSSILLSNYDIVKINKKYPSETFPLNLIKNYWFIPQDLNKILTFYKLTINDEFIDTYTPGSDLVKLQCEIKNKHGKNIFSENRCEIDCKDLNCNIRKVPNITKVWGSEKDLRKALTTEGINVKQKNIEYHNADYDTIMYFFKKSFKGAAIENEFMQELLSSLKINIFYGNETEVKLNKLLPVNGFLTSLLNTEEEVEIVSFIPYTENNNSDISKAIYRMTSIGLIDDFTQDYINKRFRIVSKRKKEGGYYNGLKQFLLRYYTEERANVEIKNAQNFKINNISEIDLENEINKCLGYLTSFVYDKISVKRKRSIDDIRNFCLIGIDESKDWKVRNEELKDYIYYYFNSKYAKEDYIADNGEPYSLTTDTDGGKISSIEILFKYLKVVDDEFVAEGVPIDNVKHLQGAVRLIRRSLTDKNPALELLNVFCLFFLGTKQNTNLENELQVSYNEGMEEFKNRINPIEFWDLFDNYNKIISHFANKKQLAHLKEDVILTIHGEKINDITEKYLDTSIDTEKTNDIPEKNLDTSIDTEKINDITEKYLDTSIDTEKTNDIPEKNLE